MTDEELVDDGEALGCLEHDGDEPVDLDRTAVQSLEWTFTFPPQQHHFDEGDGGEDPREDGTGWTVTAIDNATGTVTLSRGKSDARRARCRPRSSPAGRSDTKAQQAALRRFAASLLAGDGRYPHLERLLRREPPLGGALVAAARARRAARAARPARGLVPRRAGAARVGQDLPRRAADHASPAAGPEGRDHGAEPQGDPQPARRGGAGGRPRRGSTSAASSTATSRTRASTSSRATLDDVARSRGSRSSPARRGCSRARSSTASSTRSSSTRPASISLADTLACGTSARRLVLLGDPLQLAQVTQGVHPDGSGASVARARARRARDDPGGARHLPRRRRGGCTRPSAASSRRRSTRAGSTRSTSAPSGRPRTASASAGSPSSTRETASTRRRRRTRSPPRSSGSSATRSPTRGGERPLRADDVMVVAPYNAQVRLLHGAPAGRRRGRHRRQVPGPRGGGRLLLDGVARAARTSRAGSTSCSRATASTSPSRARSAWPTSPARRACSRWTAAPSSTCGSRTRCASSRSWCLTRCENRRHDDSIGGGAVATSSRAWYEGPARARTASADSVTARAVRSATLGATWR